MPNYNFDGPVCRRILVDTGEPSNSEYITNLKKVLAEQKVSLQEIVITHWHFDHVGGVSDVCKHTNCKCNCNYAWNNYSVLPTGSCHFLQNFTVTWIVKVNCNYAGNNYSASLTGSCFFLIISLLLELLKFADRHIFILAMWYHNHDSCS